MFQFFVTFVMIIVNIVLQSTVFKYIGINDTEPNTMILIIASYAILRGDVEGAVVGFFAGLLQDIYFGKYIGLHALLGTLTGYFCGKPFKDFYLENYLIPLSLGGVATLVYEFLFYLINYSFRGKSGFSFYFVKIILPTTVYNIVISIPIYMIVYAINKRIVANKRLNGDLF